MHALATSQGRHQDITRDIVKQSEYQRMLFPYQRPELSGSGGGILAAADGYQTVEEATWQLKTEPPSTLGYKTDAAAATTAWMSDALPLQRLEKLESDLASLSHARRRLEAFDDEPRSTDVRGGGAMRTAWTEWNLSGEVESQRGVDTGRLGEAPLNGYHRQRFGDSLQTTALPLFDATQRQRVQAVGPERDQQPNFTQDNRSSPIRSSSMSFSSPRLPPLQPVEPSILPPPTGYDSASGVLGTPSKIPNLITLSDSKTESSLQNSDVRNYPYDCQYMFEPQTTPSKYCRELFSPQRGAVKRSSPANEDEYNHQEINQQSDRESSKDSSDEADDCSSAALRSVNAGCSDPPAGDLVHQDDEGDRDDPGQQQASTDALKPAFWMVDYKQPKRCKKGNCTFQTANKIEFWEHLSVHFAADKLYRCERCPFRTPLKHHMTSHRMNHDDDKPFRCDECSYRAVSQSMVNSHKKSHSAVRPYVCDYPRCHYATKFVNQLTKHREKQHPGFSASAAAARRRRRSGDAKLLGYDECAVGLAAASHRGQTSLSTASVDELSARSAAAAAAAAGLLPPWPISPHAPPAAFCLPQFQLMQRMAALSGLPLYPPPSPLSLRRPDERFFCPPPPSAADAQRSLPSTPPRPPTIRRELSIIEQTPPPPPQPQVLTESTASAAAYADVQKSFIARLAAAGGIRGDFKPVVEAGRRVSLTAVPKSSPALAASSDNVATNTMTTTVQSDYRRSGCEDSLSAGSQRSPRANGVDEAPLDLTAKPPASDRLSPVHEADIKPQDQNRKTSGNQTAATSARKPSRRKGVAHKLNTTSINCWNDADAILADDQFDLPLMLSITPQTASAATDLDSAAANYGRLGPSQQSAVTTISLNADPVTTSAPSENRKHATNGEIIAIESSRTNCKKTDREIHCGSSSGSDEDGNGETQLDNVVDRTVDVSRVADECRHCGFTFRHQAMFDIHMGFHKHGEPWTCNRCGQPCSDRIDFNRHIASVPHSGQL